MKQSLDVNNKALFVEVPKPVHSMSDAEKGEFIDEILKALEGN